MTIRLRIKHCFLFGEKRKIRKYGIKIKRIWGEELSYDLIMPMSMVKIKQGPLGGTEYIIHKDGIYLGHVYVNSLHWNPNCSLGNYLYM